MTNILEMHFLVSGIFSVKHPALSLYFGFQWLLSCLSQRQDIAKNKTCLIFLVIGGILAFLLALYASCRLVFCIPYLVFCAKGSRGRIQRKTWCPGPYAGVDYNLTLCSLQSRLQHMYHGHWATLCQIRPKAHARVDFIPQSGTWNLASGTSF
jgi:hypothetical protein